MFWSQPKVIRVELTNLPPIGIGPGFPRNESVITPPNQTPKPLLNWEQFFKLAAVTVAFSNAPPFVLGYMRYAGVTEPLGISRTEISFSVSDLLSFGYVGFLNMTLSGQLAVGATSTAVALPVMALVMKFKERLHTLIQLFIVWIVSLILFFLLTGPYWFAYNPVRERTLNLIASQLKIDPAKLAGVSLAQEIWTETGYLSGVVILAMPDATYLLKDDTLYKVRASDGKVVRKTHIVAMIERSQSKDGEHAIEMNGHDVAAPKGPSEDKTLKPPAS